MISPICGKHIVYLLGCGKQKQRKGWTGPAEHLYTGTLFKKRMQFTENVAVDWYIVSAKYGLLERSNVVEPYDLTVKELTGAKRHEWALCVALRLLTLLCFDETAQEWKEDPANHVIHLHMGADYVKALAGTLYYAGFRSLVMPVEGLGQGEQMRWYSEPRNAMGGPQLMLFN